MRTTFIFFIYTIGLGSFLLGKAQSIKPANDSVKNSSAWIIKNRVVPPPSAVSKELNLSISSIPQPDYTTRQYVPKNQAEWKTIQNALAKQEVLNVTEMAQKLNVTVEQKTIGGVSVYHIDPKTGPGVLGKVVFIHIHGGAYVFSAGKAGIREGILLATLLKMPVLSVDYKMPPDHPYPAALDDVIGAYKGLLDMYPTYKVVIGGTSAGGGLTMAAILRMKELKLKLPNAVFLGTPWSDLTKTGDSYYINEGIDRSLVTNDGFLESAAKLYGNGISLKDPYLSPIYGDLSGFPPTFLVTGTRDLFLSNTVRTHRKLRDVGTEADLVVIEGMSHGDYMLLPDVPESQSVFRDLNNFLKKYLSARP
ncbi:alpha/beta hydrolase [Spirosoma panaciterrae]|uniref:alpha/beta hydrolase n=1 Tax=Spirosoma panaciterrae TaxID=496058 RepID=UPI00037EA878|nr:alpha/beta hydrolase [Spirosoma panaciterrae]